MTLLMAKDSIDDGGLTAEEEYDDQLLSQASDYQFEQEMSIFSSPPEIDDPRPGTSSMDDAVGQKRPGGEIHRPVAKKMKGQLDTNDLELVQEMTSKIMEASNPEESPAITSLVGFAKLIMKDLPAADHKELIKKTIQFMSDFADEKNNM